MVLTLPATCKRITIANIVIYWITKKFFLFSGFFLVLSKQINMKALLFIFSALIIFSSCKRNNGYTCDVYAKKSAFFDARKLGIEEFERYSYMEKEGPEVHAISNFNLKQHGTSIRADSATCKETHINKR